MYLAGCLPYYIFAYLSEQSFDTYCWQLVEAKARFIEQALAGEITARTVEDTSDVVLSAAEIKAIASGNPQIVRKVQLEAEVARLERVRAVWLDTRRNLQLERRFSEEEVCRLEGRRALWERAETIVASQPHEPFAVEVATGPGSTTFQPFTERAAAGATVRTLIHETQSAAAFQRKRITSVVARYRGLDLVVQAHAVFAADLSLALPDGTVLDAVNASTDTGVWQSVSHTLSTIPATVRRLSERIAQAHERIATIERELDRLETWDSQPTYDAARSELSAINAAFAAEEERERVDAALATSQGEAPANQGEDRASVPVTAPAEAALADILLALAQQDRAGDGWDEQPAAFPPALASRAWMATEVERLAGMAPAPFVTVLADAHDAADVSCDDVADGLVPPPGVGRIHFGDAMRPRRAGKLPVNPASQGEAQQLSLF